MNNKLIVKKSNSTDYIPIKYGVIEITVGTLATNTYLTLQTIDVGWDTKVNYDNWRVTRVVDAAGTNTYPVGRNPTGMQGEIGAIEVQPLDDGAGQTLVVYRTATPSHDRNA